MLKATGKQMQPMIIGYSVKPPSFNQQEGLRFMSK